MRQDRFEQQLFARPRGCRPWASAATWVPAAGIARQVSHFASLRHRRVGQNGYLVAAGASACGESQRNCSPCCFVRRDEALPLRILRAPPPPEFSQRGQPCCCREGLISAARSPILPRRSTPGKPSRTTVARSAEIEVRPSRRITGRADMSSPAASRSMAGAARRDAAGERGQAGAVRWALQPILPPRVTPTPCPTVS